MGPSEPDEQPKMDASDRRVVTQFPQVGPMVRRFDSFGSRLPSASPTGRVTALAVQLITVGRQPADQGCRRRPVAEGRDRSARQ